MHATLSIHSITVFSIRDELREPREDRPIGYTFRQISMREEDGGYATIDIYPAEGSALDLEIRSTVAMAAAIAAEEAA